MLNWPWRQSRRGGLVGVEIAADHVAFAAIDTASRGPRLTACEYLAAGGDGPPLAQFTERVKALKLGRLPCNLVLPHEAYKLVLIEAPTVPEEELREAVLFRIRDMIPMSLEDAVLDLLHLPADSSRSGKRMVYGVVADRKQVQPLIQLVTDTGLILQTIDVAEMALRNLSVALRPELEGAAVLRLSAGAGTLVLIRQESVYLTRQFELDYSGGLLEALPGERLILEVQRSLDYYERQMGLLPPDAILFCGANVSAEKLTGELSGGLPGTPALLSIAAADFISEGIDESLLQLCAGAIGGALRAADGNMAR